MSSPPRRLALVATFDERPNVDELLDGLLAQPVDLSVLVIDDASPDGTAARIRERFAGEPRVRLHQRPRRLGYGSAMREGFLAGLAEGYDTLVTLDADLSHDPAAVPELIRVAEASGGVAIGSRYLDGGRVPDWELWRRVLSRAANLYVRSLLALPARDCTSGFRAYRREALLAAEVGEIHSRGYAFLVELLFRALRSGVPVAEVPIVYRDRRVGRSKMSSGVVLESAWTPLRLLWRARSGSGSIAS